MAAAPQDWRERAPCLKCGSRARRCFCNEATADLSRATVPFPEHAMALLVLAFAAGGEIVVRDEDMVEIGNYKLVVTLNETTGDKTYSAVDCRNAESQ